MIEKGHYIENLYKIGLQKTFLKKGVDIGVILNKSISFMDILQSYLYKILKVYFKL